MLAVADDGPDTAGWLACHYRHAGCEWLAIYSDMGDEPAARRIQARHHRHCRHRPNDPNR